MASINEIVRSRKAFWRQLQRLERSVDSAQERLQRKVGQVIKRKTKAPTEEDLVQAIQMLMTLIGVLDELSRMMRAGYAS
jgi:hypothetical protein